MINTEEQHLAEDTWIGAEKISQETGIKPASRIYHLASLNVDDGGLPTFHIGKFIAMRRSTYLRWIERQEAAK